MLRPEYQENEAGLELVSDIFLSITQMEEDAMPSALEEGKRVLRRFEVAMEEHPEAFVNGKALGTIRCLVKAVERCGVTLEQLGTSRRQLFKRIRFSIGA
jgi:hypothetical protein